MSYYYPLPDEDPKNPHHQYQGRLHLDHQYDYQDRNIDAPYRISDEREEFNRDDPPPSSSKSHEKEEMSDMKVVLISCGIAILATILISAFVISVAYINNK